jgi:hypothetical protein
MSTPIVENKPTTDHIYRASFPKNDYYIDDELDTFFGKAVKRHNDLIGQDGINFSIDQYRRWLMNILQQEGFNKCEDAYAKYPFLEGDEGDEETR